MTKPSIPRMFAGGATRLLLLALLAALLAGCASQGPRNPRDPFERYNRSMSHFNEDVDRVLLKPAATAYAEVVPDMVRTGVRNFFANLADLWTAINGGLQLKPQVALDSLARFGVNSTFGLGGLIDVADSMRIDRHREDLGQTLGHWGVPSGPYLVLPILGPSTVRDTAALFVERPSGMVAYIDNEHNRIGLQVLMALEIRANLLRADSVLDGAALDKYSFTRDAFLQRRRSLILDGEDDEPPPDPTTDKK